MKGFLNSLISLFVGFVFGIVLMSLRPNFVQEIVPFNLRKDLKSVEGTVIAKGMEGNKLLMTVDTPEGVVLVTFTRKIAEINLLVEKGDLITLGLPEYEPFVTDPVLKRVKKPKKVEKRETLEILPSQTPLPEKPEINSPQGPDSPSQP